MRKDTTPTVDAIGQIALRGNTVPHLWYQHPLLRSGASGQLVNLPAITLLADIVYWYRPREDRDEASGVVIAVRKRFAADKMHKNYDEWGRSFGLTKGQVQDALAFLKERGIITVEARTITVQGRKLPNVMFIEPVPEVIAELCRTPETDGEGMPKFRDISADKKRQPARNNGEGMPKKKQTNTKSISESTNTENNNKQPAPPLTVATPADVPPPSTPVVVASRLAPVSNADTGSHILQNDDMAKPHETALIQKLMQAGVKPEYVAADLVRTYPAGEITAVLASDGLKTAKNPGGYIRTALKNRYDVSNLAGKAAERPAYRIHNDKPPGQPTIGTEAAMTGIAGCRRKLKKG